MNKEDEISYYQGYTTNKGVRRMKLTIITGPQGSGKTLLAKQLSNNRFMLNLNSNYTKYANNQFAGMENTVGFIDEYTGKEQISDLSKLNGFLISNGDIPAFRVHFSEIIICTDKEVPELLALEDFEITVIELKSYKNYVNYAEAIKPDELTTPPLKIDKEKAKNFKLPEKAPDYAGSVNEVPLLCPACGSEMRYQETDESGSENYQCKSCSVTYTAPKPD